MPDKKYTHVPVTPRTHKKIKKLQERLNKESFGTVTLADTVEYSINETLEAK